MQLVGIVMVWGNNLLYSLGNFGQRIIFFIFNISIFIFLLSRPVISMFRGNRWWYYPPNDVSFSLNALLLTLLALFIGAYAFTKIFMARFDPIFLVNEKNLDYRLYLKNVTLFVFLVVLTIAFLSDVEKFLYVRQTHYEAYYASFTSHIPSFIRGLGSMTSYVLCIYLACLPSKKESYFILISYVIAAVPTLLMGQRNQIVLRLLFSLIYFLIRNYFDKDTKWIGKYEKIMVVVGAPVMIVLLGAFNYIRAKSTVETNNIFSLIIDFFYKQGTTFDTLTFGHKMIPKLPFLEVKNYTFGGFIDSFNHGLFANVLFGASKMPANNGPVKGMMSNDLAHNLAYVYRGQEYIDGNGNGSSYLLELFIDYGYVGIVIFSLLLGVLTILFIKLLKTNNIAVNSILLICLSGLFYICRSGATSWLEFFVKPTFLLAFFGCFIAAVLFKKLKIPLFLKS